MSGQFGGKRAALRLVHSRNESEATPDQSFEEWFVSTPRKDPTALAISSMAALDLPDCLPSDSVEDRRIATSRDGHRDRLMAIYTLTNVTAVLGVVSLLGPVPLVLALLPLHVYFAVHNSRATGIGSAGATAAGLIGLCPIANGIMLLFLNKRLAKQLRA